MSERAVRFPANFPVVLRKGPKMFQATICNINNSGGCILGPQMLAKGETAILDYEFGQTRAKVIWTTGKMTGLSFETQLSDARLHSIRAATLTRASA